MSKIRSILIRFCTIFVTILVLVTLYQYVVKIVTTGNTAPVDTPTSTCETIDSSTQVLFNTESTYETTISTVETTCISETIHETVDATVETHQFNTQDIDETYAPAETVMETLENPENTTESIDVNENTNIAIDSNDTINNTDLANVESQNQIGVVVGVSKTLNVRTAPTTNSEIINSIKNDSLVIVCETICTDETNSVWHKIIFKNTVGYVSAKYIDILEDIHPLDSREDEGWFLASTATTRASSSENRDYNIALACSIITEKVIPLGEDFSWFDAVGGSCSKDKGFKEATIFVKDSKGNTILSKGFGGGVCQVSTTIHIAVKGLGIDEDDIHAIEHSKRVSYASIDEEASVSYPYRDFSFKNTLDKTIVLEMISFKGSCMCNIYVQNK